MNKHIVIIGGIGPQASISLHQRIIRRAAALGARDGADFPEIIHLSLPVQDFISDPSRQQAALDLIVSRLERLYLWPGQCHRYGL